MDLAKGGKRSGFGKPDQITFGDPVAERDLDLHPDPKRSRQGLGNGVVKLPSGTGRDNHRRNRGRDRGELTVHGLTVVNGKRARLIIRIVIEECKRIVKGG
jgi:hypothetical protein